MSQTHDIITLEKAVTLSCFAVASTVTGSRDQKRASAQTHVAPGATDVVTAPEFTPFSFNGSKETNIMSIFPIMGRG